MRRPRFSARGRRGATWLTLALVAGLLAAGLTLRAVAQPPDDGRVVVAAQNLAPGLLIDAESVAAALSVSPIPASVSLPGTISDPSDAIGRRVAVPVAAGEPITQAVLGGAPGIGPEPLAVGERAVAVPLSAASGVAAGLGAGTRVDVVASTGEGPAGRTTMVVSDAEVLAVAEAASVDGQVEPGGEALLRVSSGQALHITAALNFAREVRLLVRPQDEVGAAPLAEVDAP